MPLPGEKPRFICLEANIPAKNLEKKQADDWPKAEPQSQPIIVRDEKLFEKDKLKSRLEEDDLGLDDKGKFQQIIVDKLCANKNYYERMRLDKEIEV